MKRRAGLPLVFLILAACQATSSRNSGPADCLAHLDGMDAATLEIEKENALRQHRINPRNCNRLRAGYTLSRPVASLAQLEQSHEILAEIPASSKFFWRWLINLPTCFSGGSSRPWLRKKTG